MQHPLQALASELGLGRPWHCIPHSPTPLQPPAPPPLVSAPSDVLWTGQRDLWLGTQPHDALHMPRDATPPHFLKGNVDPAEASAQPWERGAADVLDTYKAGPRTVRQSTKGEEGGGQANKPGRLVVTTLNANLLMLLILEIEKIDVPQRDWELITLEDPEYASSDVSRWQTKRGSKWSSPDLRLRILNLVTSIRGVDWDSLKAVDCKLLYCAACEPWEGYQLVHTDHNRMGPKWLENCIQVHVPLADVHPSFALQVGVGTHIVGQHAQNRWDVRAMSMGDVLVMKGCAFHRGAGGGPHGAVSLFIPFVPLEHPASMSQVHLARELYALPHMSKHDIHNGDNTHFFAPILVGLKKEVPYCGDVVLFGGRG